MLLWPPTSSNLSSIAHQGIAERIFENSYASAPSNERASCQCQEQDLEASVGFLEDLRNPSVEQASNNATEEQARLILNRSSHAIDTVMASRASNKSTVQHIPLANV